MTNKFRTDYVGGRDKASARDLNARGMALNSLVKSGPSGSTVDATGIHTRRPIITSASPIYYARILTSLRYPDPDIEPNIGISKYVCHLVDSTFGMWSGVVTYSEDDYCYHSAEDETDNVYVYRALMDSPDEPNGLALSTSQWEWVDELLDVNGIAMESSSYTTTDFRYWNRWFMPHDIVPVISYLNQYYFLQTLIPCGRITFDAQSGEITSISASIRWNQEEARMMAVFR